MTDEIGEQKPRPVRVFRNVKRGCYSIMRDGMVFASARQVRLADVKFLVREGGRQRMLSRNEFNVHAYAVGRLVDFVHPGEAREIEPVGPGVGYYDPHRFGTFVVADTLEPLLDCEEVLLDEGAVVRFAERRRLPRAA